MEKTGMDKVWAFDNLFTTNQLQMLKVLISYIEPSARNRFIIYIKFMELQYTMTLLKQHPDHSLSVLPHKDTADAASLIDDLLPLCSPAQKEKILQMKDMMANFENLQEMLRLLKQLKEASPEGTDGFENSSDDLLSGLAAMSGMPDISELFEMLHPTADSSQSE